jgi:hypothetical protein
VVVNRHLVQDGDGFISKGELDSFLTAVLTEMGVAYEPEELALYMAAVS